MDRKYETIFIAMPELGDEELKGLTAKVSDVVASYKGEIHKLEDWGVRKLAYAIRKQPRGRYLYLRYDGSAELIAELERRLRLDDKVLRYQSVKLDQETKVTEKPVESKAADAADSE
ncbi:MAG TPA: 30S ribosomal protein S6 [Geobacterales bacterium]|nr:30S ribosomal protein S6 [Geobacterales bacterium]